MRGILGRIPRPFGRRWLVWQSRRAYVREWNGSALLVFAGVLDPVATKVGAWLADVCAAQAGPGERWVDMGTGSGVVGLALAARGAVVTSVDIDPQCVRNARANAALHQLPIEVVQSDLFAALPGRRFDRVVYNVPFWPGDPGDRPFGRAMYAGADYAAIRRFVEAFPAFAPEAWVVLSEHGGDYPAAVAALGPATRIERAKFRGEWLSLYRLMAAP